MDTARRTDGGMAGRGDSALGEGNLEETLAEAETLDTATERWARLNGVYDSVEIDRVGIETLEVGL
jgi:hypothetical protein